MTDFGVPGIEGNWALFLDLDGTLLDLAPAPDAVVVPSGLTKSLDVLRQGLGGALAIVTGRARDTVDRLLAPLILPGGFGHGAELRDATGAIFGAEALRPMPAEWAPSLARAVAGWPGVLLERKPHGLALHYRAAPHYRDAVRAALAALLADDGANFDLLPAHMAFEIRPRIATKGRAVATLMAAPPFAGRRPVFVGDDVTDEDGMQAAHRLGGFGLWVGRDLTGGPDQVRAWLADAATRLAQGSLHARA